MLRLPAALGNPLRLIGSGFGFGERLIAAERGRLSPVWKPATTFRFAPWRRGFAPRLAGQNRCSGEFIAHGRLARGEKSLHQLAFTADRHAWKSLEPTAGRNLRFPIQSCRQQTQLVGGDLSLLDAIKQVLQQRGRQTLTPNLRHGPDCRRIRG